MTSKKMKALQVTFGADIYSEIKQFCHKGQEFPTFQSYCLSLIMADLRKRRVENETTSSYNLGIVRPRATREQVEESKKNDKKFFSLEKRFNRT